MIAWGIETLVASTLLMLLVLAIRHPVRRAFGPNMAYALWALPVLRMVLPPLPDTVRESAVPLKQASESFAYYVLDPLVALPPEASEGGPSLWPYLFGAWALGAAGFVLYHLVAHGRFCARVRRDAAAACVVADGRVSVIETDAATGPLAFGVLRKYVAFPRDFAERYDALERDLALAHELGHHARGDLIANWIALAVLALHWFNPVAWRAFRAFRADQEMACDALVLAGRAAELRHAYGRAIVKSAHGGAVSAACHLHTINEIKGRLRMLSRHEKTSRSRLAGGVATVAALSLAGLGATASGTQAAERVRTTVETATGVDIAALELPKLPELPQPPARAQAAEAPAPAAKPDAAKDAGNRDEKPMRVHVVVRVKDGDRETMVDDPEARGRMLSRTTFVFNDKDGKATTRDADIMPMPPMPPMPPEALAALKNMPEMASRNCAAGEGDERQPVIRRDEGGKRIIVFCQNRFKQIGERARASAEHGAAESAKWSGWSERYALTSALSGLRSARRNIERSNMSAEQRSSALAGIDQAIREMEHRKTD